MYVFCRVCVGFSFFFATVSPQSMKLPLRSICFSLWIAGLLCKQQDNLKVIEQGDPCVEMQLCTKRLDPDPSPHYKQYDSS